MCSQEHRWAEKVTEKNVIEKNVKERKNECVTRQVREKVSKDFEEIRKLF